MAAFKAPKGTKDVLPEQSYQWQFLETRIRQIVQKYGLSKYYAQRLFLVEEEIQSLFEGNKPKQISLAKFMA